MEDKKMKKHQKPLFKVQDDDRCYASPAIIHRGTLKQFAGSPMSKPLRDPLNLFDK